MLSRHADSAYWIGRYTERAEATARMIDVHYHFGLESPLIGPSMRWSSILAISGQDEDYANVFGEDQNERLILEWFAFNPENPSSIFTCVRYARENAHMIRDQISSEMWEVINRLWLDYRTWDIDRLLAHSPFEFFKFVKQGVQLFQGVASRTMPLGETSDFHDCGVYLERADQTARLLDVKYHDLLPRYSGEAALPGELAGVGGPVDVHGWVAVLRSVGAYEAFRKTFRAGVTPSRVAQFLILTPQFPASVRHAVGQVNDALRRISNNRELSPGNAAERAAGRLYNDLNYMRAEDIILSGLHEFLEDVQARCADIGDSIAQTYLQY